MSLKEGTPNVHSQLEEIIMGNLERGMTLGSFYSRAVSKQSQKVKHLNEQLNTKLLAECCQRLWSNTSAAEPAGGQNDGALHTSRWHSVCGHPVSGWQQGGECPSPGPLLPLPHIGIQMVAESPKSELTVARKSIFYNNSRQ